MNFPKEEPWEPNPELLAAFFDGEFEGRDDLTPLRLRLENWLASHPEARAEFTQCRRLKQLWLETTPADPGQSVWWKALDNLEERLEERMKDEGERMKQKTLAPTLSFSSFILHPSSLVVVAASLLLVVFLRSYIAKVSEDNLPFPVAAAHEVTILHVDGAHTGTIVVGELPVKGPLVLVGPGEVVFTSVKPASPDNMVPEIRTGGPGAPFIWAHADP